MKLSTSALLISSLLLASPTWAETYQSFSSIGYKKTDLQNADHEMTQIGTEYFFSGRQTLGPLNEFSYINDITNLSASYSHSTLDYQVILGDRLVDWDSTTDNFTIGGEWFVGNFLLGADYSYNNISVNDFSRENQTYSQNSDRSVTRVDMSLGYLITDDFLIKLNANKVEGIDIFYTLNANYNLQLNKTDYIGFGYDTNEDFDFHHFSTKYFMALADKSYLVAGGGYTANNFDYYSASDHWNAFAGYYFNQFSSVFINYDENETYSVSAKHFFNKNYSLDASYSAKSADRFDNDYNVYTINFTAQF